MKKQLITSMFALVLTLGITTQTYAFSLADITAKLSELKATVASLNQNLTGAAITSLSSVQKANLEKINTQIQGLEKTIAVQPEVVTNQVIFSDSKSITENKNNLSCDVDLVLNTNTCGLLPFMQIQMANKKALAKISFDPKYTQIEKPKVTFDVYFGTEEPDGWNINIGDSNTNNGYAGDGSTSSNDAEVQILSDEKTQIHDFGFFGNDQTPVNHTTDKKEGGRTLYYINKQPSLAGKKVSFVVGDQYLKVIDGLNIQEMNSSDLFALKGQADSQGPINYDLYAAFNRVIDGDYRSGKGVEKIHVTFNGFINNLKEPQKITPANIVLIPKPTFSSNVSLGTQGEDVKLLQQTLKDKGYFTGTVTGLFGPKTLEAVKTFQNINGIAPTGYVGPKTIEVLGGGGYTYCDCSI